MIPFVGRIPARKKLSERKREKEEYPVQTEGRFITVEELPRYSLKLAESKAIS